MPNNVIYPRPQFVNSSGVPLASGTFSTYAAGTTTAKPTYPTETDLNALTNPNPTVMTLSANGRPMNGSNVEADIWLNGAYKFVVADSTGTIVYTSDHINDPSNILDASGNIILGLSSVGSANYINLAGAATGLSPTISFKGSDTNVNGTITCQGSGILTCSSPTTFSNGATITTGGLTVTAGGATLTAGALTVNASGITGPSSLVKINGSAGFSGGLQLGENTSNGSNTYTLKAPASFGAGINFVLPSTNGSNTQYLQTDGSGNTSWQTVPTQILGSSGFLATMSALQTINLGTNATLNFDTKAYDILSEFNTTTHTFTATNSGTYLVMATVPANDASTTTVGEVSLNLQKNSTTIYSVGASNPANTNWSVGCTLAIPMALVANDTLRLNWASVNANYSVGATGSGSIATANATFSVIRLF